MDIKFNATTIDSKMPVQPEQKQYWEKIIQFLIDTFEQGMDLTGLKGIFIPENYKDELFEYQKQIGVKEWYTDDDIGRGVAQVVSGPSKTENSQVIFICKELIFSLFDDDYLNEIKSTMTEEVFNNLTDTRALAINTIHHELAHVQEESITSNIPWIDKLNENKLTVQRLRQLAMTLWREYYACRISATSHELTENDTTFIVNLCERIEKEITSKRREYNLQKIGLNDFVELLHHKINSLFKFSAYAHGNFFKLNVNTREQIIEMIKTALERKLFQDSWVRLGEELNRLFVKYPNWDTIEILDDLGEVVVNYIGKFNIAITDTEQGTYYDIPVSEGLK